MLRKQLVAPNLGSVPQVAGSGLQNSAEHAPNCYWRTSQSLGVSPVMALNAL